MAKTAMMETSLQWLLQVVHSRWLNESLVKRTYSDVRNLAQVYEIRYKLKETKQGNHCVTQYYTNLQALWQELDLFIEVNCCPKCIEKKNKQRRLIEKERFFDFFVGVNEDLDEMRGRILGKELSV